MKHDSFFHIKYRNELVGSIIGGLTMKDEKIIFQDTSEMDPNLLRMLDRGLEDIEAGRKYMKVYRQMKMYNDPSTNPVLYGK